MGTVSLVVVVVVTCKYLISQLMFIWLFVCLLIIRQLPMAKFVDALSVVSFLKALLCDPVSGVDLLPPVMALPRG